MTIEILRGNFDRLKPIAKLYQQRYEYIDYTALITAFLKHIGDFHDHDVHTLLANGKVKEGKRLLETREGNLSVFYKTLILLIEDSDRKIRKEEYTTGYHNMISKFTEAHPLVRVLKVFGKENFGSDFGEEEES